MSVALITAGSAGLGAAAARIFAKNGFRVIVNYANNEERANKLLEELPSLSTLPGDNFVAIKADLGSRDEINRLIKESVDRFGRLDVIFSNGGWTRFRGMESIDDNAYEEEWDRAFNMNVKSHLWLMQASKKYLDETEGAFITTASIAGVIPSGSSLAYSATKAAQIHLVKALAVMAAPKIRVNTVSPGLLLTEWGSRFSDEQKEAHLQKTKLKRFVSVEDVAEQVFTFAKSKSTTGINIVMDSGFIL
ncbi:3-oxoacyl-[acyl-carrier-protein] reductase FabG [Daldinia childiae]|uniref:3-oxoacyl-[acyl-carrier-protein] reductase FabG n=1 Tax=Daldinia childiae TaxID=326645 RepID=UPI001448A29D|nr:3-oxoacyl-[acyl-carrier-protein] reductase FabG [Daldinia childiae]KAF3056616.1 3-oxoacyl-[acyl-carrier-protein] reductase FabG [Daldinia childiae]